MGEKTKNSLNHGGPLKDALEKELDSRLAELQGKPDLGWFWGKVVARIRKKTKSKTDQDSGKLA